MPDFLFLLVSIPLASPIIYVFHISGKSAQPRTNTGKSRFYLNDTLCNNSCQFKTKKSFYSTIKIYYINSIHQITQNAVKVTKYQ